LCSDITRHRFDAVSVTQPSTGRGATAASGAAAVRITAVEAIPYSLPYRRPARFASGSVERADNVLVRVHSDAGLVGQAEAQPRPYTYGETQATIVSVVTELLASLLVGADPLESTVLHDRCGGVIGNHVARGAVDLAVWDLAGKVLGQPASRMLGDCADHVIAAHMVSYDEPAAMASEATEIHDRLGVRSFKVKVGRSPDVDIAATRAIREALPDADLYVDANRGWSYDEAVRAADGLLELGVRSIEEPLSLDDVEGRRRLARRWPVPLVGDESCISLRHVEHALDDGAVGTVSVKTARTGYTESRRILELCAPRATPVVMGSQYEGGVGALATIGFAAAFAATASRPAELTNFLDLEDDLLAGPLDVRDGRVPVRTEPGLGVAIDEERLDHYRIDR
jgi:L-alanine-DL-glutamate epimerase-like enolase superfamily enzyme